MVENPIAANTRSLKMTVRARRHIDSAIPPTKILRSYEYTHDIERPRAWREQDSALFEGWNIRYKFITTVSEVITDFVPGQTLQYLRLDLGVFGQLENETGITFTPTAFAAAEQRETASIWLHPQATYGALSLRLGPYSNDLLYLDFGIVLAKP